MAKIADGAKYDAQIIALANQKGGVGKTALTVALAGELSARGKVLVVDMDPQANATAAFGIEPTDGHLTALDVLAAAKGSPMMSAQALVQAIEQVQPPWHRVWVVPAERDLADRELDASVGREAMLKTALDQARGAYDWILIDCPPSLGLLTVNALVAADRVLIVTEPRNDSVKGATQMVHTVAAVRGSYNPALTIAGVAVNLWQRSRTDCVEWADRLRASFGELLIEDGFVPDREAIRAAVTARRPIPDSATDVHQALHVIASHLKNGAK